jgi:hypothetical protein
LAATGGHEDVAELLRRHHVMLSASLRVENQEPIAASSPSPDGMERDGLARCYVSWEWFFCRSGTIATRCRLIVGPTRDRVPVSMPTMSSRWWSRSSAGNCLSTDGRSAGWSTETRILVRDTVERAVVRCGEVQIIRKPAAMSTTAKSDDDEAAQIHVAPLRFRVRVPERRSSFLVDEFPRTAT